jgi:putative hydrolase of the HAD superfamily
LILAIVDSNGKPVEMRKEVSMRLEAIAFDADDTLWHSECHYRDSEASWLNLLAPYDIKGETALAIFHRIEIANLTSFGFGIKGFILSMIEAAIEATGGKVSLKDIQAIIELGKAMTRQELRLMDYSAETVAHLAKTHPLMLITKGDLMDQERKIASSGLAGYFGMVEVVSSKTAEIYAALLQKHSLVPERFLMIGNSIPSDILPVLEIGGWGVYVPHALTWAHETSTPPVTNHRYFEIEHLGLLPDLVNQIENRPD